MPLRLPAGSGRRVDRPGSRYTAAPLLPAVPDMPTPRYRDVYPVARLVASLLLMTVAGSAMYAAILVLEPAAAEFGTGR